MTGTWMLGALIGATACLGVGLLTTVFLWRRPGDGQRWGEAWLFGAVGWLVLTALPLPRPWAVAAPDHARAETPAAGSAQAGGPALVDAPDPRSPAPGPSAAAVPPIPFAAEASPSADRHAQSGSDGRTPQTTLTGGSWWASALGIWLGGTVLLWGRLLLTLRRVSQLVRSAAAPEHAAPDLAATIHAQVGPRVRVAISDRVVVPFCTGWWRPVCVLPRTLLERPADLLALLAHEGAHLQRHDPARRVLLGLALPLLWFHPLAWWLHRRVLFLAEVEADCTALAAGIEARAYGRALLDLAERLPCESAPGVVSALSRRSQLSRRFTMFLRTDLSPSPARGPLGPTVRLASLGAVLALGALSWGRPLAAQDPQPSQPRSPAQTQPAEPQRAEPHPANTIGDAEIRAMRELIERMTAEEREAATSAGLVGLRVTEAVEVRAGDSLSSIAARRGLAVADILRVNPGIEADRLAVGQTIQVPTVHAAVIARIAEMVAARTDPPPAVRPQQPEPAARPARAPAPVSIGGGISTATIDLLDRWIEARGDTELAEARLESVARGVANADLPTIELRQAEIRLRTAKARLRMLEQTARAMAKDLGDAADVQHDLVKRVRMLAKRGFATAMEVVEAERKERRIRAELALIAQSL